eukprot:g31082.t1
MSQELQALLARIENIPKDSSGKELQDTLHRLDRDVARQHARLDDLEHERREGCGIGSERGGLLSNAMQEEELN